MTEIKFRLSKESIDDALKQLQDYKKSLKRKCDELCSLMLDDGYSIATMCINSSALGNTITLQSEIKEEDAGVKAILTAIGTVEQTQDYPPFNTLLAVEFGAGIRYNSANENPKASEFGMGVGTFSEKHFGLQDTWYYYGNDNKWHPAHGVEATMPMYNASMEMERTLTQHAREVFGRM